MIHFQAPRVEPATLPLVGGGVWTVRRLICIGRNYAAHAAEMGADVRSPPFHFLKHAHAVWPADASGEGVCPLPPQHDELHHEVELAIGLTRRAHMVSADAGWSCIGAAGVAIDLTRRDVQRTAKASGRPWASAKDFDAAAPFGWMQPLADPHVLTTGAIALQVNGAIRQEGDLSDMTWSAGELVAQLSMLMTLHPGDVILTGTPSGVAALQDGDRVMATIAGLPELAFHMGSVRDGPM
ncbi:MAG: fumarylacetoacetate hydrolase family protein [Myxococcota bacterium]